jgi:hypothetical protein
MMISRKGKRATSKLGRSVLDYSIVLAVWLVFGFAGAGEIFADIAPVISWPVDVTRQTPYALTLRRGETVILQPVYNQDLTGATAAVLKTRQTGATAVYATTGTVYSATGGVCRIRLDVTATNAAYQYEIGVVSSNATLLRSYGTLTVVDSMAGEIPTTPAIGTGDTLAPSEPEGNYPNDIAPVLAWTVRPDQLVPYNLTLKQGETAILQPTFDGLDFSGAAAVALRYRPTGASGWHYVAPGTIHDATGGVARVRWDSTIEGTNTAYQYEIAVQSSAAMLLRAYGTITVLPSLSGSSTSMPVRVTTFDWAAVEHVNLGSAPFLSEVILAPFAAAWASLTNGTADLNVGSILVDGQPIGAGGGGIGSYTNTEIAGVSHSNSVRIGNGSNLTWRLRSGVWCPDVPIVTGPQGPQGPAGSPSTNVTITMTTNLNVMTMTITNITIGGGGVGSFTNVQINGVTHSNGVVIGDSETTTWVQDSNGVWRVQSWSSVMPATWDTELINTNELFINVGGMPMIRFTTNGIVMTHGSLQMYEEDLNCNVRLYDGTRLAPSLTFLGHTNEWGLYARGYNGNYVAGWSVAGTEVGLLHQSGLTLMSTNFAFYGRLVGDISSATGYPEPIFEEWRTNMFFTSIAISNLTMNNGPITIKDSLNTTRGTLDSSGLTVKDAGGVTRSTFANQLLTLKNTSGLTTTTLDTNLKLLDVATGNTLVDVGGPYGNAIFLKTPSGFYQVYLSSTEGLQLFDSGSYAFRSKISPYGIELMTASSQLVFKVDSQTSLITTMNGAAITNSGNLTFHGALGTNLCTITGSTGAIKIRGVDSDTRYPLAPTGMTGFIATNVVGTVTQRIWYTAQGVVTNHVP